MYYLSLQATGPNKIPTQSFVELSQARDIQIISPSHLLLKNVNIDNRNVIQELAYASQLDFAFFPSSRRLDSYKVMAMDMDSTLINIECIDEIAAEVGKKQEVAAITEAAMRGEITNFSESLIRRVALLKGTPSSALETVYEKRLQLNPGAKRLLRTLQDNNYKTLLVSGGFTFFTKKIKAMLNIDEAHANELEIEDGYLTGRVIGNIVDAQTKADLLHTFCIKHGYAPQQAIAIGDGANDLKMMALAGMSIAYHAKPIVRENTDYAINFNGLDTLLNWFNH